MLFAKGNSAESTEPRPEAADNPCWNDQSTNSYLSGRRFLEQQLYISEFRFMPSGDAMAPKRQVLGAFAEICGEFMAPLDCLTLRQGARWSFFYRPKQP